MRDVDIWLGDGARALRVLEVTDDAAGAAVLHMLGLGMDVPEVGTPESVEPPSPPATTLEHPAGSPEPPPPPSTESGPAPQTHLVRELEPEPDAGPWPNPWASVVPLTRSAGPPPPLTLPALLPLPAARHILSAAVATSRPGRYLDAPAAVAALARGQLLRALPYRPVRTPRRGVQVLIDQGVGLEPFRRDVQQLVALLRTVVGSSLVKTAHFVDLPMPASPAVIDAGVIDAVPYRPPDPGTPVLAVTDLGISGRIPVAASAVQGAWRGLADLLRDRDSPLVALVPYPPQRWPAELRRDVQIVGWDRTTTIRHVQEARAGRSSARVVAGRVPVPLPRLVPETDAGLVAAFAVHQPEVVELAELLSPAVQVEPELLRQVRLAAAPHLDVGTEADLWSSPLLRASGRHGFSFSLPIAAELRDRLSGRWHDVDRRPAVERAREVMSDVHAGSPPPLRLEEHVAWHVVTGDLDQCEAELAPAVAALAARPDSGLEFWAEQAASRLPDSARATTSGWVLCQLGGTPAPPPDNLLGLPIEHALRALPTDRLLVRHNPANVNPANVEFGATVELGTLTGPGVVAIHVPRTRPYLLELSWREGSTPVRLGPMERVEVPIGRGPVWLRTVTGVRFQLDVADRVIDDPAPACVFVPIGDGKGFTGFFVAPDLIVTVPTGGLTSTLVTRRGEPYSVNVVSQVGAVEVLRLIRPLDGVPVLPVDATMPLPHKHQRWTGAVAVRDGTSPVDGWIESVDSLARFSVFIDDRHDMAGVPVLVEGRLVGMIPPHWAESAVGVQQIAEALAQVPPRPHALQLLEPEDSSWSPTVSDENLTGGTLWIVRRLGIDDETAEDTYTLAGRISYLSDHGPESFPRNIVNDVLRQIAPAGNIDRLLSHVTMLADDDVHLLERHLAYWRAVADSPAMEVTAADAGYLIDLQNAISLELHTDFENLTTDRSDVRAAMVAALGAEVFDLTVRSYAEGGIRDCGDPVVTPHWIEAAAHYGLSGESTLPGFLRVAARVAVESAGSSQVHSVRVNDVYASERLARELERFGLKVDHFRSDGFQVEGSDAALRAALTQLARVPDDDLESYGSVSAVTAPQPPYSPEVADRVSVIDALLKDLSPPPFGTRFELTLATNWREYRDELTAVGAAGFGPELDIFGFIDGFQKLLAIGLDAAARRVAESDYRMKFGVRPDTARWLVDHGPFAIEQESVESEQEFAESEQGSVESGVSLRLPFARLAALFAWAAPRLTASLRAAATDREYRERNPAYRNVVVASGHLIDAPDRTEPRFPPEAEPAVTAQVRDLLERWSIGSGDLVLTGGARGGDLIVAEQALERGAAVTLLLAFPPEEFVERSVALPGSDWSARFDAVRSRVTTLVATDVFDPPGEQGPYVRVNRWLLDYAQALRVQAPLRAIAVWDGHTGDGAGGTADFVAQVRRREVDVAVVDPSGTVEK